jgi:hypothetical protein
MKLKLIEDPLLCSACNTRKAGLGLHDGQCNACGMGCRPETGETKPTDELLLLSWHQVLREYEPREPGGSRW